MNQIKREDSFLTDGRASPATPVTPAPPLSAGPFVGAASPRAGGNVHQDRSQAVYTQVGTPQHTAHDPGTWLDHTSPGVPHPQASHPGGTPHSGTPDHTASHQNYPMAGQQLHPMRTASLSDLNQAAAGGPITPRSELSNQLMSVGLRVQKE